MSQSVTVDAKSNLLSRFGDWTYDIAYKTIDLLPDSPIQEFADDATFTFPMIGDVMGYINYFVPIGDFVYMTAAYVSACAAYIGVRYLLRMSKMISQEFFL